MVEDGLAQSQVYAIAEDARGYLWFGTRGGGISRFDGFTFKNFSSTDGLCNDYINVIRIHPNGNLWIGTDKGICIFDGSKFREAAPPGTFSGNRISDIFLDEGGTGIWVATDSGLFRQNESRSDWQSASPENQSGPYYCMRKDQEGRIWAGTEHGLIVTSEPVLKKKAVFSWVLYNASTGLANEPVRSIMPDEKKRMWISHYGGGVSLFDPSENSLEDSRPFKKMTVRDGLPNNIVVCSMEDREGNIWFGTIEGGACRFDGREFKYFTEKEGLATNNIRAIHEDAWGNVWFGTSGGGVTRFGGDEFVHFRESAGLPGNRIYCMAQDSAGFFWLGTSGGGISRFDGNSVENFGSEEGFMDQVAKSVMVDDEGILWIGTEGMGLWQKDTSGFHKMTGISGIQGNWVRALLQDRSGRIWIGTADAELMVWDGITAVKFDQENIPSGSRVNALLEDREGKIWIGTENYGLIIYNGKQFKTLVNTDGLCSDMIRDFAQTGTGDIWTATSEGLTRIVAGSNGNYNSVCMGREAGLNSANLYLLLADTDGNLWAGSEKGVDKLILSPEGKILQTRFFGKIEGFSGIETCQRSALEDAGGMLWFGTMNGLSRYDPDARQQAGQEPIIHLTSIRLFYEEIGLSDSLILEYDKNHLGFEFLGINQRNPEKVRYRWMLENFDADWSPASTRRDVTWSNIPPGEYIFKVMAANEGSEWPAEALEFPFAVNPPYWETLWFRIPAGAFALGLLIFIFIARERQIRRRNAIRNREIQMEKSMLELEQKALRLQMNPHFIFNALNSIKGIMAENDTASARKYLVKFAQLMRHMLVNSRSSFISLINEVKTLEHYLDLERLSRNNKFRYEIRVEEGLQAEEISIPPMIVQPFVENSILHGIAPMEKEGLIRIEFVRRNGNIQCTISDNGIGRKESAARKKEGDALHESQAVVVTTERLKLLTEAGGPAYEIRYRDLKDGKGMATGTEVMIEMPVGR